MTKLKYFWTKIRYYLHINQGFASTTPQILECPISLTKYEIVLIDLQKLLTLLMTKLL